VTLAKAGNQRTTLETRYDGFMSAISVVWSRTKDPPAQQLLRSALSALSSYGSGRSFSWNDPYIALGGTLSGILPEDIFDVQPLWSPDRSVCLVADVRLDNRAELVQALSLVHPEELADSYLLMAAWLRWGQSCLDHIVGSFAFAVWTPSRQELFAARDHVGDRPLFYHRGKDFFALASMPKGLLALPGVFRGFEESRIVDWLGLLIPDLTQSLFVGVECLPFGHTLRVTPNSFECKPYWHPSNAAPVRFKRDEEYPEALLEILDRATEARLRSNKSAGSLLSAGFDCASVTVSAARLLAAQRKSLTSFTSVPRPDFNDITQPWEFANEGPAAAEVARIYPNIRHVLLDSTGYEMVPTIKQWTDAWDEPAVNVVNMLWFTAILDQAREQGINVLLEGTSGNGTISWETQAIFSDFFRQGRWIKLAKTVHQLRKNGGTSIRAAAKATLGDVLPLWAHRLLVPRTRLRNPYSPLANPELLRKHALPDKISKFMFGNTASRVAVEHALYLEQGDFGPFHAASQAVAGIEFRDPTADKRVYDFCFAIPPDQYIVGGHSRSLVRRAMKGRLPDATVQRYIRGLQGADWYLSTQEALPSLRDEVYLQQQSPEARRTLDLPKVQQLLDNWPSSGYHTAEVVNKWESTLTRAISMGYFLRSHESAFASPAAVPSTPVAAPLV
jgi:asparagine synthase (glutamine-hydrolysing)